MGTGSSSKGQVKRGNGSNARRNDGSKAAWSGNPGEPVTGAMLNYKASTAYMPDLQGTPRQVEWAQTIRESALKSLDLAVNRSEDKIFGLNSIGGMKVEPASMKQARVDFVRTLQRMTSAGRIIDNRSAFEFNSMVSAALRFQTQQKRKK